MRAAAQAQEARRAAGAGPSGSGQSRRAATRYDRTPRVFLAFGRPASVMTLRR